MTRSMPAIQSCLLLNLAVAAAFVPSLAPARPPTRASSITCVYADDETAKAKWLAERTDEKATTDVTAAAEEVKEIRGHHNTYTSHRERPSIARPVRITRT